MDKQALQTRLQSRLAGLGQERKFINPESVKIISKHLGLGVELVPLAQDFFERSPKSKLVWLHLCECTGCSESLLRTELPGFDEFIFDFFDLDYHETLMASSGFAAEAVLEELLNSGEDFILAVEGGVAAIDTYFLTIGERSGAELLEALAARAAAVFAVGTCSSFGGIQAAAPNPSKTCGIAQVLARPIVHIPGCPPSDVNILGSLFYFALFGELPQLDEQSRPLWAYGKCLHELCERKGKFEAGIFAQRFDDEAAKTGACLFKLGCKGPYTKNNCPKVKFNSKTSWPVASGHGCVACSEANFWDDFGFYEQPMLSRYAYERLKTGEVVAGKNGVQWREIGAGGEAALPDAVADLENKALNFEELKENLKDDELVLYLREKTQILLRLGGEVREFLSLDFDSNLRLVLAGLAKNKLGASLVENYKMAFPKNYEFIQENYDEAPRPSGDIWDFFELGFILARGEF